MPKGFRSFSSILVNMPVAVVTGSSSGIGACTAEVLAARGYSVVLHAHRNIRGLQATAGRIQHQSQMQGSHAQVVCMTGNLADRAARRELVRAAFAWQGSVEAWVNNAGADVLTGGASQLSFDERLELLWRVDVEGTIAVSRLVTDAMHNSRAGDVAPGAFRPVLINVGWDQAWLGMEGEAGQLFGPIKGAVMAFTRSLALSVAPRVRVNCVAPGWIQTSWGAASASTYWDHRAKAEAAMERWGTPQDVAEAIAWLASPQALFVHGQTLEINGGRRYYPVRSDLTASDSE
jgi:3-oxoacyl-[acyl-carrier protein] reductase